MPRLALPGPGPDTGPRVLVGGPSAIIIIYMVCPCFQRLTNLKSGKGIEPCVALPKSFVAAFDVRYLFSLRTLPIACYGWLLKSRTFVNAPCIEPSLLIFANMEHDGEKEPEFLLGLLSHAVSCPLLVAVVKVYVARMENIILFCRGVTLSVNACGRSWPSHIRNCLLDALLRG